MQGRTFLRLLLSTACILCASETARADDVWLSIGHRQEMPDGHISGALDFYDFMSPKSNDQTTLRIIKVFKFYSQFFDEASDEKIRSVLSFLDKRGIAVALESSILTSTARCGENVEAYGAGAPSARSKAAKIKRLGGNLRYIAMDEPLWYGRFYEGHGACHASIDDLVGDLAKSVAAFRDVFPDVRVGDIEPIGRDGKVIGALPEWLAAIKATTRKPLDFFQADIVWDSSWGFPLRRAAQSLSENEVTLGVIFNGSDYTLTATQWTASAKKNARDVDDTLGFRPAQAVFQSWRRFPKFIMPETADFSLLGVVHDYESRGN